MSDDTGKWGFARGSACHWDVFVEPGLPGFSSRMIMWEAAEKWDVNLISYNAVIENCQEISKHRNLN